MRRRLAVLAGLFLTALAVFPTSVSAATTTDIDTGFYIGGGIGQANLEDDDIDFSADDTGAKVILGWRIFKYFAVEANWADLGTAEDTGVEVATDALDLAALGIIPIGGVFEVFGKAGVVSWDTDVEISGSSVDADNDGEDPVYGIGGAFRLGESFQIRLEYEIFEIEGADELTFTSVSATFTF